MLDLDALDFEKQNGLVTVVTVDAASGRVLMIAHADRTALEHTIATGEMHYRSRSRGLWHKGATSGHFQRVISLTADCDRDAVLARVHSAGPACHTGTTSCFGDAAFALGDRRPGESENRQIAENEDRSHSDVLDLLDATIAERSTASATASPSSGRRPTGTSYTQALLADRNLRIKKLGEEAAELVLACADDDPERAAEEGADVIYHTLVALRALGVSLDDVRRVLAGRASRP